MNVPYMSSFSLYVYLFDFLKTIYFVLQSLEFDLIVYAPYRSVEGFINDLEVSYHPSLVFHFVQNSNSSLLLGTILK